MLDRFLKRPEPASEILTIGTTTVRLDEVAAWRVEAEDGANLAGLQTRIYLRSGAEVVLEGERHTTLLTALGKRGGPSW